METLLINHCAPVLAGLKTGNLFNYKTDIKSVLRECKKIENTLFKYGVSLEIIKSSDEYSLIYVYRKHSLENDVQNPLAARILKERGYKNFTSDGLIKHLKQRIKDCVCFPHEIGLFLSYPPEDVKGFIENRGYDFKLCGYWKVYCNEENALKKFALYRNCTNMYVKLFKGGKKFEDLIVAV